MYIFLIVLAVLLFIIAATLFLPIPISVRVVNKDISVKLFNLPYIKRRNKTDVDKKTIVTDKKAIEFEDIKLRISVGRNLYKQTKSHIKIILVRLFKVARVIYYRSVITMGFDDPMNTGMSVGVTSAFLTEMNAFFVGLLSPRKQSYLSAVPNFNESGLNFVLEIKLHISVFNSLLFFKEALKYKNDNQGDINIILGGNTK